MFVVGCSFSDGQDLAYFNIHIIIVLFLLFLFFVRGDGLLFKVELLAEVLAFGFGVLEDVGVAGFFLEEEWVFIFIFVWILFLEMILTIFEKVFTVGIGNRWVEDGFWLDFICLKVVEVRFLL